MWLNVACILIYGTALSYTAVRNGHFDSNMLGHLTLVVVGSVLAALGALLRERSRRSKFLASQHAEHQKKKCTVLLSRMLPSQSHVNRLMNGESVVEKLEDITMLYRQVASHNAARM